MKSILCCKGNEETLYFTLFTKYYVTSNLSYHQYKSYRAEFEFKVHISFAFGIF